MKYENVFFKLNESDYFFEKFSTTPLNDETHYNFSGFLSSTSSVICSIRKSCNSHPEFEEWNEFQIDKFNRYMGEFNVFKKLRDFNTHQGFKLINSFSNDGENHEMGIRFYEQERDKIELDNKSIDYLESINLISESEKLMNILSIMVWDGWITFGKEINPDYIKTMSYLKEYDSKGVSLYELFIDKSDIENVDFEDRDYHNLTYRNYSDGGVFEKYLDINIYKPKYPF